MRVVVTGSSDLMVDIGQYLPCSIEELVCGSSSGIEKCAKTFADKFNIPCLVLKASYEKRRSRNAFDTAKTMVDISDYALIIWDGKSKQTKKFIDYCDSIGKHYDLKIISKKLKTA